MRSSKTAGCYEILNISRGCSKEQIKKAYRTLVHKYHPDKKYGSIKKFREIQEAYNKLYKERFRNNQINNKKNKKSKKRSKRKNNNLKARKGLLFKIFKPFFKKVKINELVDISKHSSNGFLRREAINYLIEKKYNRIFKLLFIMYKNDAKLKNRRFAKKKLIEYLTNYKNSFKIKLFWKKANIKYKYLFLELLLDNEIVGYKNIVIKRKKKLPYFLRAKIGRYLKL